MIILSNNNGHDYEIIAMCGYNKVDREYYKNSRSHISAYALLELQSTAPCCKQYIVASSLTRFDWGNGTYFDNIVEANDYYNQKVAEYFGD